MPSPVIHLQIADRSSKLLHIENESQFFLGSISPDAIHMGENNNREYKRKLHLTTLDKDIITRILDPLEKYNNQKESFKDISFLKGIYSHIIADNLRSHGISRYYLNDLYEDTPRSIVDKKYYQEMDILENECIKLSNSDKIVNILKESNCFDYFDLLKEDEVVKWKNKTIEIYSRKQIKTDINRILSNDLIEDFMKLSIEVITLFFSNELEILKKYLEKNCREHSLIKNRIHNT